MIVAEPMPDKLPRIRYLMVAAMVECTRLRHPPVDAALEALRGDDVPSRNLRRTIASLRDHLAREAGPPDPAHRLRPVDVLLDALGDDATASAQRGADHAYLAHLTDDPEAVIVILERCLRRIDRTGTPGPPAS
ncbi:hypothetical protein HII36_08235 [Nonomuraea sp. NN258]|uniref:hypothetical protein n=1 Tax=Nonomuraea antri TaxID=2730852 RepID=UPI001569FA3B|nr:hypothetical protein [Nonomuraea antri]NRQ31827.1 hypothetical protein [Nonomuraea antri]